MTYAIVPAQEGSPQVGRRFLHEAKSLNATSAVVCLDGELEQDWQVLSELEYLAFWRSGYITADKSIITADGLDTATVTAEVHPDLTEITFYHADTGEAIATVPVDPATHTATLQVTATTPGIIRIRAGEPTVTRLNEVVINAT